MALGDGSDEDVNKDECVLNACLLSSEEEASLATNGSCLFTGDLALTKQQRFHTQSPHFMHFAWHQ